MKILVVYDSVFGNTEQIARAIGAALAGAGEVQVLRVTAVTSAHLAGVNLLLVGSPTRGFAATPDLTAWLANLPAGALTGVRAVAFDTRIDANTIGFFLARWLVASNYADKKMQKVLLEKGATAAAPSAGFIVKDREGPLREGELERASTWAKTLLN